MIRTEDVFKPDFNSKSDFKGPIVLHMIDQEGFGDVSLGMKIAKFLAKKYPDAPIYVMAKEDSIQKIKQIEPSFLEGVVHPQIQVVDWTNTHGSVIKGICDKAQLAVETAIFDNSLYYYHKNSHCTKIFIGEYGLYEETNYKPPIINLSGNVGKKKTGEDYPGILIEPDLKEFSRLPPTAKQDARAKILDGLDPALKKQVLGNSGDDSSSFIKNNSFAFSYYNFHVSYKRAATVFAASNEPGKHANYFVSASKKDGKDEKVLGMLQEPDFQEKLKQLGYTRLVFYTGDSEEPQKEIILDKSNPNGREFRVFERNRFTHDTTLDLMRLSDLCGVAGDQSLTEAFSLGTVPIPEEWYCQRTIVGQIANTHYRGTAMETVDKNTWNVMDSVEKWAEAGEHIRKHRSGVQSVITRFQEEANLYNALDHRLNLEIDKPRQENIDKYNQAFINALEVNQKSLKKDKDKAFYIATEIARYYAKWQPSEPLTMSKILDTMSAHVGKRISHIDNISYITIQKKDYDLVRSERSGSFIKRHITHSPSRNKELFTKLESLRQQYFAPMRDVGTSTQEKGSKIKEQLLGICHELTENDLDLAIKYLAGMKIDKLGEEIGFGHTQYVGETLSDSYHFVEKITPCEEDKSIKENQEFTITLESYYSADATYKVTLSREQVYEFSERQKELEAQSTYSY
ncbi:hypothetical protein LEAN103870_16460 [Legionella anisa]|uniref:Uncharacterized protein n=1 Tax=Legionella anisa TaxID=28082 RepID=A0AAX0WWV4_9GAMM|nr:hypothetical protein [Legionella anisa]AWN72523.1 hypothetical protein DLD14_00930 [Legionella anisa]KTC75780.1 hypothetical protein Lani_0603 [Legionella anisa]MCW8423294.1 hypothetical protein [Legionella anisa]MCW8446813.1 hypothetical protein [Legionella anisa]PNL62976.1 hypothetical protein A6J39_018220 [Legionella anisa]